jgi:uncharacterized protein YjiS (DUF1127 family)
MSYIRTTIIPDTTLQPPRPVAARPFWRATLERWQARLREREQMLRLDERELRDAGLTAYDVAIEARKLPWRA